MFEFETGYVVVGMFDMDGLAKFLGIYHATCFQKGPCEPVLAVFKAPILGTEVFIRLRSVRQPPDLWPFGGFELAPFGNLGDV